MTKYQEYEDEVNMKGITHPVAVKQVPKFEKQNNISVNVFGYEEGYFPLYISPDQKETHVNLLLIQDEDNSHYCLIKDLNKMLYS